MDKSVLDNLSPEEKARLDQLRQDLEGRDLAFVLTKLGERFDMSVGQIAASAEMDESALHKVLHGEHRHFKAGAVDALLDDLVELGKLKADSPVDLIEKSIWHRSLRIGAFVNEDRYKMIEPRILGIADPQQREQALAEYLRNEYPALAKTYDATGGQFPAFVPLACIVAHELLKQWGPEGTTPLVASSASPTTETRQAIKVVDQTLSHKSQPSAQPATKVGRDGKRMILIPAGWFWMGSDDHDDDEKPLHRVYLDAYYISETPVTNAEYKMFVDATGHRVPFRDSWAGNPYDWDETWRTLPMGMDNHPVVIVSWDDANAYASWAGLRLPTEAEWEKAARGTDRIMYPWGNEFDKDKCNTRESGIGHTTPVGIYADGASPYTVLDMSGNVAEWCADWYGDSYYMKSPQRNPKGPDSGETHILRGGSWCDYPDIARCASRFHFTLDPSHTYLREFYRDLRFESIGFRLAESVSP